MTLSPEQILFETFQKLDDATKHRFLMRMQQSLDIPPPVDVATWLSQTQALRMRVAPITDIISVLDDVRNGNRVAPI
jgi:hypothetical protein